MVGPHGVHQLLVANGRPQTCKALHLSSLAVLEIDTNKSEKRGSEAKCDDLGSVRLPGRPFRGLGASNAGNAIIRVAYHVSVPRGHCVFSCQNMKGLNKTESWDRVEVFLM